MSFHCAVKSLYPGHSSFCWVQLFFSFGHLHTHFFIMMLCLFVRYTCHCVVYEFLFIVSVRHYILVIRHYVACSCYNVRYSHHCIMILCLYVVFSLCCIQIHFQFISSSLYPSHKSFTLCYVHTPLYDGLMCLC